MQLLVKPCGNENESKCHPVMIHFRGVPLVKQFSMQRPLSGLASLQMFYVNILQHKMNHRLHSPWQCNSASEKYVEQTLETLPYSIQSSHNF